MSLPRYVLLLHLLLVLLFVRLSPAFLPNPQACAKLLPDWVFATFYHHTRILVLSQIVACQRVLSKSSRLKATAP